MTRTPCSPAKSRLTLSTLRPHNSAISAGEKCRSIAAVWDRISMTCCDARSIHPLLTPHAGPTQRRHQHAASLARDAAHCYNFDWTPTAAPENLVHRFTDRCRNQRRLRTPRLAQPIPAIPGSREHQCE
jgi:hypothetical protein